ncbi:MAG: hypothetical protein KA436_04140 [Oligoflexales bacterium]|nr:hypothetical protein [Oligoflexales bacterium]
MKIPALLLAAALFPPETPLSKRLEGLKPYFSPAIGSEISFEKEQLNNLPYLKTHTLTGIIQVRPPSNACLTIIRDNLEDLKICEKPTDVFFSDQDLDEKGNLHWMVKSGPGDFGTPVTWSSPYRAAKMVRGGQTWPGESEKIIVTGCEAVKQSSAGRRLYISLMSGEKWAVSFPEKDELVPQPKTQASLFISEFVGRGGFVKIDKEKPSKQGSHKGGSGKKKVSEVAYSKEDPNSAWQIPPRYTYTMNGAHFLGSTNAPPNSQGECRYNKRYEKTQSAVLECQDVGNFRWIFLPLVCLADVIE